MRISNKWMLVILVLAIPLMACGLGGLLPSQEEREALVQEAAKAVEEIAAEVAEEEQTDSTTAEEVSANASGDAAAVAVEEGNETSEEVSAIAAEGSNEESGSTIDQATGNNAAATLPFTDFYESLKNLDSYLAEYQISIESPDETANVFFRITETSNPRAIHLLMESSGTPAGTEQIELYIVDRDGNTTVFMKNPDGNQGPPWIVIAGSSMDDAFGMLPVSPGSFGSLPHEGQKVGNEDLNGIPTTLYTISKDNYATISPGIVEAEGRYWFSEEYQILIKAYQRVVGSGLAIGNQTGQASAYTMNYEIKQFNDPSIVVTVPEEALNSDTMSIPGISTDPNQAQFPLPTNAVIEIAMTGMLSATTPDSIVTVRQFYEQTFGGDMEVSLDTPANIMATVNHAGGSYQLMIIDEGGTTRIVATAPQ